MKNRVLLLTALLTLASVAHVASAAQGTVQFVGALGLEQSAFWDGGGVDLSPAYSTPLVGIPYPDRCAQVDPCFAYGLDVVATSGAARLRVALDTPSRDDGFEMKVISPSGVATTKSNSNSYSMEALIAAPAAGRWTITVVPSSAEYASFRMRAKLEAAAWKPSTTGELLPNLRVTRMWEFGFAAPANPGNGLFPPDDVNPPLSVLGYQPVSCSLDEQLGFDGDPVKRCLRYSFGLANAGEGNFDIRYNSDRTGALQTMTQCVQNSDATVPPRARAAGQGAWFQPHGHFHYYNIVYHDVWQITDRSTWARTKIGTGKKIGYSPADQGIANWRAFTQMAPGTAGGAGNCAPGTDSRLGMSVGWGDTYRYQRPGNFVSFEGAGDGWYVVHTIADPENVVLESNESDNSAYTYIRVIGTDVQVLESGIGEGPWDPNKVLFDR